MPTIVKHNPTAKHYILLGAGFGQWSTARPNRILGDLFPTENAAQTRLLCLCDEHGQVEWALDDQVTIIQTDAQSPAQILTNFPNPDAQHAWSDFRPFPDLSSGEDFVATTGPGLYELRRISTKEPINCGRSITLSKRMRSLLPAPVGSGTRDNAELREYNHKHRTDIEYRTLTCSTEQETKELKQELKAASNPPYKFND